MRGRIVLLLTMALVLSAVAARAQSLAEVAKKEKERRDKNQSEATRVITERELQRSYGGLPQTSSTVTGPQSNVGESGETTGSPDGEGEAAVADETQTREYWQTRVNAAKEKITTLETRLSDESWGEGQRVGVDPRGQNNLAQRQETEQLLTAARAELQAVQAEARRAGVPPGWVR